MHRRSRSANMFNHNTQSCRKIKRLSSASIIFGSIILITCLTCLYFVLFTSKCHVESTPSSIISPLTNRETWQKRIESLQRSDIINLPNEITNQLNPRHSSLSTNNISGNCHSLYKFDN